MIGRDTKKTYRTYSYSLGHYEEFVNIYFKKTHKIRGKWKEYPHRMRKGSGKMLGSYRIRTDLAVESKEKFEKDNVEIQGVTVEEEYREDMELRTTVVKIETDRGAKVMEKPKGTYITIEAPGMVVPDEKYHQEISEILAVHLKKLMGLQEEKSVLIVGLGNRDITPDALGPEVVQNLRITRHIVKEYGKKSMGKEKVHMVSGLIPGVMAQTGMETLEIIQGVVEETKPDMVVAIDALAARSMKRLNCTIQITDTGINPGSGVQNFRNGLNEKSLGIPVIGIGIPTVVDAATIVHDAIAHLLENLEEAEMEDFLEEIITPRLHTMYVTPKDVDESVKILGSTIGEALNIALAGE